MAAWKSPNKIMHVHGARCTRKLKNTKILQNNISRTIIKNIVKNQTTVTPQQSLRTKLPCRTVGYIDLFTRYPSSRRLLGTPTEQAKRRVERHWAIKVLCIASFSSVSVNRYKPTGSRAVIAISDVSSRCFAWACIPSWLISCTAECSDVRRPTGHN